MPTDLATTPLRLALPKGRIYKGVVDLLSAAGVHLNEGSRNYRPRISLPGVEVKLLKPQNIVEMLDVGSRDVGFAGIDWVNELGADLVEIIDTGLDPVRVVAAAPRKLLSAHNGELPKSHLMIASEYEQLTRGWIKNAGLDASFVRSYGATEVFPPEDADIIVDNTATGSTLEANDLEIVHEIMRSSTRLFANPRALEDPVKKQAIDHLEMLLRSVLQARARAMIEVNVEADLLDIVVEILPCMREPTISSLHGQSGYALKAAVPRTALPTLIPQLKEAGATDIVVSALAQIVP